MINLVYNFSDDIVSEWIGDYLEDHPDISSKELFKQISAQYGEFADSTDATPALIKIKQDTEETHTEQDSRMTKLAKLAYQNSKVREGSTVQVQLAENLIDALSNLFIKKVVERSDKPIKGLFISEIK